MIQVGSDFSGVGAFDQALKRLDINYKTVFACDMDKFARQTYIHNYGEPHYYPENVYNREIPKQSLDIYMTSPPCQAFSLAGKRKGEDDKRGVLFYNSHEFITKNRPRYFIFENVKGLLSDDSGKTFQRWIDYLGGKSVNGNPVIFPLEESVPYHVYHKVLNAKDFGVPQNRERVFIVGIRDDADNNFNLPMPFPLEKRLKDVLEDEVDEKYFLSDKMLKYLDSNSEVQKNKGNGFKFDPSDGNSIGKAVTTKEGQRMDDNFIKVIGAFRGRNPENTNDRTTGAPMQQTLEINKHGTSNTITSVQKDNVVVIGNLPGKHEQNSRVYGINGVSPTLTTMQGGGQEPKINRDYRIRKLTPRECFRLMDFPESFSWPVSNSQAYKQAGNSIVVEVLAQIISKLNL